MLVVLLVGGLSHYLRSRPTTQSATEPTQILGAQQPDYYQVTHIADGDTIDVDMSGKTEAIRLIGVDTPESVKPSSPVQCYGHEASDFTKRDLAGQIVHLEAGPSGTIETDTTDYCVMSICATARY